MSKKKRYVPQAPTALIVWTDASMEVQSESHWSDGTQPRKPKRRDHVCVSSGWLTHLDEHFAQLTQTLSDGQHANVLNIPRGMVQSITVLEPVGDWEGA